MIAESIPCTAYRDHFAGETVRVLGLATVPDTKQIVVVVERSIGLTIHKPMEFEMTCRFKVRGGEIREAPRFEKLPEEAVQ